MYLSTVRNNEKKVSKNFPKNMAVIIKNNIT